MSADNLTRAELGILYAALACLGCGFGYVAIVAMTGGWA